MILNGNEIESARVVGFMESENFLEVLKIIKKIIKYFKFL